MFLFQEILSNKSHDLEILIGFLGTNGNWGILIFTLGLLLIDIAAYIPFVKMALVVENRLTLAEQDVISHEKND